MQKKIYYVTGNVIRELREKRKITQKVLADELGVSDKAVSKWETGRGLPDISLLEPLANSLQVSVEELLSGNAVSNFPCWKQRKQKISILLWQKRWKTKRM